MLRTWQEWITLYLAGNVYMCEPFSVYNLCTCVFVCHLTLYLMNVERDPTSGSHDL